MKSLLSIILPLLIFCVNAELAAQKQNQGVFLTACDFTSGKASFVNDGTGKGYQLHLNEFIRSSSIRIIIGDTVFTFKKDSIFGYRDKNNSCFRFFKRSIYKILNPSEKILLYSNTSESDLPRNKTLVTNYYFSKTAASPLYPLTILNLEIVFGNDVVFNKLLDIYFHFDSELTAYDSSNKIYFLNRIYEESRLESEQKHYKINEYESKCSIFNANSK